MYFRKPTLTAVPDFQIKFDTVKAMKIAREDDFFDRDVVYEAIGGADLYLTKNELKYCDTLLAGDVLIKDLLIFKDVYPHADPKYSANEVSTYFLHLVLAGTGTFKAYDSRDYPDKATTEFKFKPGDIIKMNQYIRHEIADTTDYVFTVCYEIVKG